MNTWENIGATKRGLVKILQAGQRLAQRELHYDLYMLRTSKRQR